MEKSGNGEIRKWRNQEISVRGAPVSSANQSGGQVIVNGTGLNFSVNLSAARKDTPKPFVLKLKAKNIKIASHAARTTTGVMTHLGW